MAQEKNKNGLIFTANTHPSPNFIVDEGVLKMIKGNAILKVYWVIIRHTIGFQQDSIQLSNSTIAEKTGIDIRDVRRINLELKNKYKLISYNSSSGGRAIKNIQVLLPEKFYSKEKPDLTEAKKLLEANGFRVEAPEDKSKQDKKEPVKAERESVKAWNDFILWANINLTRSSKDILAKAKVEFDGFLISIHTEATEYLRSAIKKFINQNNENIIIIFKEGDK